VGTAGSFLKAKQYQLAAQFHLVSRLTVKVSVPLLLLLFFYLFFNYYSVTLPACGPGSSVGIVTDYGLDGPGSNPGGNEIFRPSGPALGPTQPPVKWVPGLSRVKVQPGRAADHSAPSSAAVIEE